MFLGKTKNYFFIIKIIMNPYFTLGLFFLLSIGFSFLCSILEAVLLSITPKYIKQQINKGAPTAELLRDFKEDIDRPLSAILSLNTIAHTVGAIGVGAMAGDLFGETHYDLAFFSISMEQIIATVMTLAILILSEIIPKTIGANNWQRLAPFTAKTLRVLLWMLFPLVWVSQFITKSLKKDKQKSVLSRVEFMEIAEEVGESAEFDQHESNIIKNILTLETFKVRDIMTPKTVMFMIEEDMTLEQFNQQKNHHIFSRIPIYNDTRDNITGIILKDDILQLLVDGDINKPVKEIKREFDSVDMDLPLKELFNTFTKERRHLAIVTDEYNTVQGLVTMEDLFETLLGVEILDESDEVADLQDFAKRRRDKRVERYKKKEE
jgi:CBS domain containing-hemolysin-like protein